MVQFYGNTAFYGILFFKNIKTKGRINNIENTNPTLKSVHITVEAGFFENKLPGLQVAIISPKIVGAHTIHESVDIESVNKCDQWLLNTLLNKRNR